MRLALRAGFGIFGRLMRFTSLIVELIRARPRLVVLLVIALQALMWLAVSMVFYRSPPGDLATLLAFGREYQVGTDMGELWRRRRQGCDRQYRQADRSGMVSDLQGPACRHDHGVGEPRKGRRQPA